MLLNFVRRPGIEPATTGLSGEILTHQTTAPSTCVMLYILLVMTAEKDTKLGLIKLRVLNLV